ncbi:uncharacterized protein simc1 [Puntigrus tetrazona]|uniref:uncharacterized protein simc1 n=1 Tax=Puntigrus tetrazona TaxID=1606681 RepID=UPI001C8AC2A5|nr:uncharacterized protein simc1 [Puntigrus tetrazona]
MEDIICVSSGSDDDSDLEVISSYNEKKEDAVPFIRTQWLQVTPVLINITGHNFISPSRRRPRKDTCSSLEVIDLSEDDRPGDADMQKPSQTLSSAESREKKAHAATASFGEAQESQSLTSVGKDVTNSECFVGSSVQSVASKSLSRENTLTDVLQRTEDYLHQDTNCNSSLPSEQLSWDKSLEHCRSSDKSKNPFKYESEVLKDSIADVSQNTKDTLLSTPALCSIREDQEDNLDSSQKWEDSVLSPYNINSPYYCPSEVDAYIFSDSSNKSEDNNHLFTYDSRQSFQTSELPSATHTASVPNALLSEEDGEVMNISKNVDMDTQVHPEDSSRSLPTSCKASPPRSPELLSRRSKPSSPTSTEILASDTAAQSPDPSMLSSPSSLLISQPSSPNFPERTEQKRNDLDAGSLESASLRVWETSSDDSDDNVLDNMELDLSENNTEDRQHICLTQYKKINQCESGTVSHVDEEDEHYGPPEPLCRQSLSLVYSTIEENYPEGTLQLLFDFIQPRYYPPSDITTHLLRGILLNPQSPDVFVIEAYNLLMKTQRYHPVDASTVPWDWELMKSVMEEQDDTRRLQTEVQYLLLQYVLQVLKDDFHFKLRSQCLHPSVAKKMFSCGNETTGDVVRWLMNAAKQSVKQSKDGENPVKEDNYLRIILSLQRMLTLALEADLTYNSEKISMQLFNCLDKKDSCRQTRLLLLRTLDSKLLRCKLLELLLNGNCPQPMSLNLLLRYLKSSTLDSDPSDGEEKWRKWDELLQLLWMLLLSYEEVVTGRLHRPIKERFNNRNALIWKQEDQVTHSAVQEAAGAFLSRAEDDIGHALPAAMQESLSHLQEHIIDMPSVISSL